MILILSDMIESESEKDFLNNLSFGKNMNWRLSRKWYDVNDILNIWVTYMIDLEDVERYLEREIEIDTSTLPTFSRLRI